MKKLSFAVSSVAMIALVSCTSDVPPPDDENAELWTPGIQSSYPDWQPPEEMPEGNPAYEEAFGEPRPVEGKATVAGDDSAATSKPVKKVDATATVAANNKPQETQPQEKTEPQEKTQPQEKTEPQVQELNPEPQTVEVKPPAPAKFMRVDVFPGSAGVDGVYAVNGERVNTSALKDALGEAVKMNKDIVVILYGRKDSAVSDMNVALDCCKAAGIENLNVMTNDDIMEKHKADVLASKGGAGAADAGKTADAGKKTADAGKKVREKLVVDDSQPSTEYTVKKGDTLSSLAKTFYHDGGEWGIIFSANKETLKGNPNRLSVGTKLVIPAVKKVPASSK